MGNFSLRAHEPRPHRRLRLVALALASAAVAIAVVVGALIAVAPTADPEATAPRPSASSGSGADPTAAPVAGSEVQPPDPSAAPRDRIPPRTPQTPRITVPLPASASAAGAVVEGYPIDLAAPAEDSDVVDTSVSSEGDRLQFTLIARTDATADAIRAHYAALWTGMGMTADGEGFRDPFTSVSLTVNDDAGTGTVYTVYGVARAA